VKPLKLTMSAFGSYATEQEIDFTKLGSSGLYLITGETGSGKTTIFDAISFALFGEASGEARDKYSMMRSDFAEEKAKTFVELEFLSGKSNYSIRRVIKKNGQDVEFTLSDGTTISGDRNVKIKIAEIIGLDREQFAQIVMIAQNDFLRFLQSGTDKRVEILRRIFGTEALKQFQEQLKELAKQESDARELIINDFNRHEVDIYKREEQFAEWEAQIKSDKLELLQMNEKLAENDKQKQALSAELAIAEELNKKFTDLANNRRSQDAHVAKANDIHIAKKHATRGEVALYKVKPLADAAQKAAAEYRLAEKALKDSLAEQTTTNTELEAATKAIEALPQLEQVKDAYDVTLKEWEIAAQNLKNLTALQASHNEITIKQTNMVQKKEELKTSSEFLSKLPAITNSQKELDKLIINLTTAEEKLAKLQTAQNDFAVITQKRAELAKEQREFESLSTKFNTADEKYSLLEEAFLKSQAGIIAQSLTNGKPCPVCGSPNHPTPAQMPEGDITEAKLKIARDAKDAAQSKREAKSLACAGLNTEITTLVKRFAADIALLIPNATKENVAALLEDGISNTKTIIAEFSAKKRASEQALAELNTNHETLTKKIDELSKTIATIQGEITTLEKRFITDASEYVLPNSRSVVTDINLPVLLCEAQTKANELTVKKDNAKISLDQLTATLEAATVRKTNAITAVASAKTLVTERIASERKLHVIYNEAQTAYTTTLQANNFSNDADYTNALMTESELTKLKTRLTEYEKTGEQLSRDITRLESETANKQPPNIENLREKENAITQQTTELNNRRDEINKKLHQIEVILKELRAASNKLEKAERSYAAVKQLSDTANGKLDFETFAQMAYFKRILRAANLRLKVMSQDRYILLHKTVNDDARKRSGLDLEVFDTYTGKARSTGSLSGGESFMASLSLAIGLSDVVQQSAGGIRLDAMFIDEGFGTLDIDVLDLAIKTLSEMAGANRIIGIISHVSELRERIDRQVQVEKTPSGSRVHIY